MNITIYTFHDKSKYLILIPVEASYENIVSFVIEQIGIGNPYTHEISVIFPYFPFSSFKSVVASLSFVSFNFFLKTSAKRGCGRVFFYGDLKEGAGI